MSNKLTAALVVALLAIILGGFVLLGGKLDGVASAVRSLRDSAANLLGSGSGAAHSNKEDFIDGAYVSAQRDLDGQLPGVTTTTIPQSATGTTSGQLSWKTVCENSLIDVNLPNNNASLTLPSSTYMFRSCLSKPGDFRDFVIQNTSSTGNFTIVISDQSSTIKTIAQATSSQVVNGTSSLNFKDFANLRVLRSATTTNTGTSSPWLFWSIEAFR